MIQRLCWSQHLASIFKRFQKHYYYCALLLPSHVAPASGQFTRYLTRTVSQHFLLGDNWRRWSSFDTGILGSDEEQLSVLIGGQAAGGTALLQAPESAWITSH
jgi:hypothetical protein